MKLYILVAATKRYGGNGAGFSSSIFDGTPQVLSAAAAGEDDDIFSSNDCEQGREGKKSVEISE